MPPPSPFFVSLSIHTKQSERKLEEVTRENIKLKQQFSDLLKRVKTLETSKPETAESKVNEMELEKVLFRFTHAKEQNGKEKEISLPNDGKVLKSTKECGNSLITCKQGFRKGTVGYFRVKQIKGDCYPCIGIAEKFDSDGWKFANHSSCVLGYYYNGDTKGVIGMCKGGKHSTTLEKAGITWNDGETIKIVVDLIKWEMSFYKNERPFGMPIDIKERDVYFLGVSIKQGNHLEIID